MKATSASFAGPRESEGGDSGLDGNTQTKLFVPCWYPFHDTSQAQRQFLHAIAENPALANKFLKGVHEDVWPIYKQLVKDGRIFAGTWFFIQQCSAKLTWLQPLKDGLIRWGKSNLMLAPGGGPVTWIMDSALRMLEEWRVKPETEGQLIPFVREPFFIASSWVCRAPCPPVPDQRYLISLPLKIDFSDPAQGKRHVSTHCKWLAHNLLRHSSATEIMESVDGRVTDPSSITDAITQMAKILGLKVYVHKGGRPSKSNTR